MATSTSQPSIRLHEMNRLEDMGRFPLSIYCGATANVLAEILFFFWLHGRTGGYLPVGFAVATTLVALNVLPVVVLRRWEGAAGLLDTPPIERMSFWRDQHRFATWVTAVASGNLFFWLLLAWAAFDLEHSARMLVGVETLALLCTFAPAWMRFLPGNIRSPGPHTKRLGRHDQLSPCYTTRLADVPVAQRSPLFIGPCPPWRRQQCL